MSEWQKVLREGSVDTLEKLAEKFGHDVIDVEALRPAFEGFQVRITPAAPEQIREVVDPMWHQYVPTIRALEVGDGVVASTDGDGDAPAPHNAPEDPDGPPVPSGPGPPTDRPPVSARRQRSLPFPRPPT